MKLPFKSKRMTRFVRVRDAEWTENDARGWHKVMQGAVWQKVRTRAEQLLVGAIINRSTSDDYRRGYMDCIEAIQGMGVEPDPELDDSEMISPIQMDGGATGA